MIQTGANAAPDLLKFVEAKEFRVGVPELPASGDGFVRDVSNARFIGPVGHHFPLVWRMASWWLCIPQTRIGEWLILGNRLLLG